MYSTDSIRNTKKVKLCSKFSVKTPSNVNEVGSIFFFRCFNVFTVNFEQVNVCLDNGCLVKFFKTHFKSLAEMNTFGWCKNRHLLRFKCRLPPGVRIENFKG